MNSLYFFTGRVWIEEKTQNNLYENMNLCCEPQMNGWSQEIYFKMNIGIWYLWDVFV